MLIRLIIENHRYQYQRCILECTQSVWILYRRLTEFKKSNTTVSLKTLRLKTLRLKTSSLKTLMLKTSSLKTSSLRTSRHTVCPRIVSEMIFKPNIDRNAFIWFGINQFNASYWFHMYGQLCVRVGSSLILYCTGMPTHSKRNDFQAQYWLKWFHLIQNESVQCILLVSHARSTIRGGRK
jgi:hypothetical protein